MSDEYGKWNKECLENISRKYIDILVKETNKFTIDNINKYNEFCVEIFNLFKTKEIEWDDKAFVLNTLKEDRWALGDASDRLRDDREVVLESVNKSGCTLSFSSERLRDDEEIVRAAVKEYGWVLELASERLKKKLKKD